MLLRQFLLMLPSGVSVVWHAAHTCFHALVYLSLSFLSFVCLFEGLIFFPHFRLYFPADDFGWMADMTKFTLLGVIFLFRKHIFNLCSFFFFFDVYLFLRERERERA